MQINQQPYDCLKRVVLFGNSNVGKTSLLLRFKFNNYQKNYYNTVGINLIHKVVKIQDISCKLQVWDTAGQERFRTISVQYFHGASGIIIVYDVSNRDSFESVSQHLQYIQQSVASLTQHHILNIQYMLLGSKIDLMERQVSTEEGQQLANENNLIFFEVSSLSSENVQIAFETLAKSMIKKQANVKPLDISRGLIAQVPMKRYNCI